MAIRRCRIISPGDNAGFFVPRARLEQPPRLRWRVFSSAALISLRRRGTVDTRKFRPVGRREPDRPFVLRRAKQRQNKETIHPESRTMTLTFVLKYYSRKVCLSGISRRRCRDPPPLPLVWRDSPTSPTGVYARITSSSPRRRRRRRRSRLHWLRHVNHDAPRSDFNDRARAVGTGAYLMCCCFFFFFQLPSFSSTSPTYLRGIVEAPSLSVRGSRAFFLCVRVFFTHPPVRSASFYFHYFPRTFSRLSAPSFSRCPPRRRSREFFHGQTTVRNGEDGYYAYRI